MGLLIVCSVGRILCFRFVCTPEARRDHLDFVAFYVESRAQTQMNPGRNAASLLHKTGQKYIDTLALSSYFIAGL